MDKFSVNKIPKVLILIVGSRAEPVTEAVLGKIPPQIWDTRQFETEILMIQDPLGGVPALPATVTHRSEYKTARLRVFRNAVEAGYGGSQKLGFHYAVQRGFEVLVLLQADGQYQPETLLALIEPIVQGRTDVILGSRLLKKADALRGGMPLYRFFGNLLVTQLQNWLLNTKFTEFHSGYRVYSVKALDRVPFQNNSNGFDFDMDILIQLLDQMCRVHENPIAMQAGGKRFGAQGIGYVFKGLLSTILSRLQARHLYYSPKFDYHMRQVFVSDPGLERLLGEDESAPS